MATTPPPPPHSAANHPPPTPTASPLAKRPKATAPEPVPEPAASTSIPAISSPSKMASSISTSTSGPPPAQQPQPQSQSQPQPSSQSQQQQHQQQQPPNLLVKFLHPNAQTPTRGSAFAAGYDLYSAQATVIPARGKALVSTALAIAVPNGCYGRIAPRSGLASKHFLDTGAGVIDADYRGEVKVLLFNHSEQDFQVAVGERVAQLVLERIYTPEVLVVEELEESVRGVGGFGSTG